MVGEGARRVGLEGGKSIHPATLSRGAIKYLRNKLKFEGMVVSDCMEMGAIMRHYSAGEAAERAVAAGIDLQLFCHTKSRQIQAIEGIVDAVENRRLPFARVLEAKERVSQFIKAFVQVPLVPLKSIDEELYKSRMRMVGCKEHESISQNIFLQAAAIQGGMKSSW